MPQGVPPGVPRSMPLNAPYNKEQEYIWFMGGDLNCFQDIIHFMNEGGEVCPRGTTCGAKVHVTNMPYHKEQEYIWFIGGDLNSFKDIKHFMK